VAIDRSRPLDEPVGFGFAVSSIVSARLRGSVKTERAYLFYVNKLFSLHRILAKIAAYFEAKASMLDKEVFYRPLHPPNSMLQTVLDPNIFEQQMAF